MKHTSFYALSGNTSYT